MKFKDHIVEDAISSNNENNPLPMTKLKLMKRESCSCESGDRLSDSNSRRSKSIGKICKYFQIFLDNIVEKTFAFDPTLCLILGFIKFKI